MLVKPNGKRGGRWHAVCLTAWATPESSSSLFHGQGLQECVCHAPPQTPLQLSGSEACKNSVHVFYVPTLYEKNKERRKSSRATVAEVKMAVAEGSGRDEAADHPAFHQGAFSLLSLPALPRDRPLVGRGCVVERRRDRVGCDSALMTRM